MKKLFNDIKDYEIPYDKMKRFGITKNMIDDLPQPVLNKLISGQETPLISITRESTRGERIRSYARIFLTRLDDETVEVGFIPQLKTSKLNDFTLLQQNIMLNGDVTIAELPQKGRCYAQYDTATNQVISVPEDIINQNISIAAQKYNIDKEDEMYLHDGKPLQIPDTDRIYNISIGINLICKTGIQITKGNLELWHEEKKNDLPKFNFGKYGCWVTSEDGELKYVDNEHFTLQMKEEKEKAIINNRHNLTIK